VGSCEISIADKSSSLSKYVAGKKTAVVTDRNVRRMHGNVFQGFDVIEIDPGEKTKTLDTAQKVFRELLALEMDRSSFLIGIGGGMICDMAGFCASTYMRGIGFGFVPTTLLAQADASIGGKNGVNLHGVKNIIGVFSQPEFVLIDFDFLKTLSERELYCGIAEIIKHALIRSEFLFEALERNGRKLASLQSDALERTVTGSLKIKSEIVTADTKENGKRRLLNLGHTLGHAIEASSELRHGEAVSLGIIFASKISEAKGMITSKECRRIQKLLEVFRLPTYMPFDKNVILETMKRDKKRWSEDFHFVLLSGIGKAEIVRMPFPELEEYVRDLC